eukprot:511404-Amphidinium_carterae.1
MCSMVQIIPRMPSRQAGCSGRRRLTLLECNSVLLPHCRCRSRRPANVVWHSTRCGRSQHQTARLGQWGVLRTSPIVP